MELVLNTFGTYLTKENNTFLVVHKDGNHRIEPEKLKSISISRGARISSDAAILAIDNQIDVFFVDNDGRPVGRIWSNKYGSVSTIRKNQVDFSFSKQAVGWIKDIIEKKIDNQIAILLAFITRDSDIEKKIDNAIVKLEDYKSKIRQLDGEVVSDIAPTLRGWEGASGKVYFECLKYHLPLKFHYKGRSQHPATDVFNCLLNYGYGMLYGKVEGALIKSGIDPYIGIFHRDDYNRPVLVYDVIEEFRSWVDFVVCNLLIQEVIDEDCYSIKNDGSYWLETMGKRILIQSINDYLSEVVKLNGLDRSRMNHIDENAKRIASLFLNFKL